jgi:spermidine/putrescine transport system permease protein
MPTGVIVIWSLFRKETGRLVTDVSLDNYVRAFGQDIYFNALVNSVDLVAIVVVLSVVLAFPLAYVIATSIPPRWQRVCA